MCKVGVIVHKKCESSFWCDGAKCIIVMFQIEDVNGTTCHEVINVASQTEIDRKKAGMTLNLTPAKYIPENIQTPSEGPDEESGMV